MAFRPPRYRTGDPDLDQRLVELLEAAGATDDLDLLFEVLASGVRLAQGGRAQADRLDLKITSAALKEMRAAFRMFAPYRANPKITIFGSARTSPDDPLYAQARDLAASMAAAGWMVVTGAGPGIMAAGTEGAGQQMALGVSIRLPFEDGATPFLASDDKRVSMKYFFTRKLMLMKESQGFVALPGGFGTLDEILELLTLLQTGKASPAPLILLDTPHDPYWEQWDTFLRQAVAPRGLISTSDLDLYEITDDVAVAHASLTTFFRNYHSIRWVGPDLVMRLQEAPSPEELAELNDRFGSLLVEGRIRGSGPLPPERSERDHLELARIVMRYDSHQPARLRGIIDAVNRLPSAPRATVTP